MSSPKKYTAKLAKKEWLTNDVFFVEFELNESMEFQAGQFVMLDVPANHRPRAFSMVNPPSENNKVQLLIKKFEESVTAPYLNSLELGDEVSFKGPFGKFVVEPSPRAVFFVATGVGVAPFLSMLGVTSNEKRVTRFLFGCRRQEDIVFEETIRGHVPDCSITLSKPDEGWEGAVGHVTHHLSQMEGLSDYDFYLCGSAEMIKDTKKLLEDKGVPADQINFEIF